MILLVGPPGAGKSLQAGMLEENTNAVWLSMGKLLRDKLTDEAKEEMQRGELVSDKIVEDILAEAIHEVSNGTRIIIDGFPRRESQVSWFRGYLKGARRNLEAIVHLKVPLEESLRRLEKRGRLDDQSETVERRYRQYESEIVPMVEHLGEKGIPVFEVDGTGTIEDVYDQIRSALRGLL